MLTRLYRYDKISIDKENKSTNYGGIKMRQYLIKTTKSGNCGCVNCGKLQEGLKMQPLTLYWKEENEKRGHQEPMCSKECCNEYKENNK